MNMYSNEDFDKLEQSLVDESDYEAIQKFHSLTTFNFVRSLPNFDNILEGYSSIAPLTNPVPTEYYEEVQLQDNSLETEGSVRKFDKSKQVKFSLFSKLIKKCFGYNENRKRNYPSAGALYVIIPVIYIFSSHAVEGISQQGIYIYDGDKNSLKLIKKLNKKESKLINDQIVGCEEESISNLLFGYSLNINKSIAKYKTRGYRHALIETGSIIQNVRTILNQNNLYDVSWSGFNDYTLTKLSGMNPRNSPIILLQWWGYNAF